MKTHTLQELETMSDEELRVILAEICGWKPVFICRDATGDPFPGQDEPPDYCRDLNACAAVERTQLFTDAMRHDYVDWLDVIMDCRSMICERSATFATARQRTIALILTLQTQHKPAEL